jgi:hypothetical protein
MTFYEKFTDINDKIEEFALDTLIGGALAIITFTIAIILAIGGVFFVLHAIFGDDTDYGQCLVSHADPYTTFVKSGNTMIPITSQHIVCDQWEYPGGK